MLNRKQIWGIFFLGDLKMGRRAAETAHNINNTCGLGTANERVVLWWFDTLNMKSAVANCQKLTTISWDQSKLILLQLYEELWETSKSLVSECLMSWRRIKKIISLKCYLKCYLFFYATTANHFLIGLWSVVKSGFCVTASNNQLSSWTKKQLWSTSQAKLAPPQKGHGQCLVVSCWSDPLQLSESWWNHYIWDACSANWWDAPKTATPMPINDLTFRVMVNNRIFQFEYRKTLDFILCLVLSILMSGAQLS